jgi:haloalkane dehalogenase
MRINGFKYHYVDEGSGEPIVMIHGNPTWSFYFRNLISSLSKDFRTIAVDHIGCGLSDKPHPNRYAYQLDQRIQDLEYFIDGLDLQDNITLLAHDWGGMIGVGYALKRIDCIKRLILMNTAAFFPPAGIRVPFRLKFIRNVKPLAEIAVLGGNAFAYGAVLMASRKGLAPAVRSGLLAPYNCWHNRIAILRFVQDIPLRPSDPSYATVQKAQESLHELVHLPILICWGMRDFVFTPAYLAEWRRRFPKAQVHRFADAGHYVLEDATDEVIEKVSEFLIQTA